MIIPSFLTKLYFAFMSMKTVRDISILKFFQKYGDYKEIVQFCIKNSRHVSKKLKIFLYDTRKRLCLIFLLWW